MSLGEASERGNYERLQATHDKGIQKSDDDEEETKAADRQSMMLKALDDRAAELLVVLDAYKQFHEQQEVAGAQNGEKRLQN